MASIRICRAGPEHAQAINDIRNHYVRTSTAIYTEEESPLDQRRRWLLDRDETLHPVTIALEGDTVVGWASLSPFDEKCGYRTTVENSVYIHPSHHRCGIGGRLLADLIDRARSAGAHTIIARIDSEQAPSLRLHEKHGFAEAGRLVDAGFKFGRWRTVCYLQKLL